ncbi:MAG: adenosylhomocysteinase [Oscillospiraceae bacterium]|nr:adenosylhomocysteinase [Oscillospiraceae bacterium]
MSEIRDISLAPSGEMKMAWAKRYMPLLNSIEADFREKKPFAGLRMAICLHLEAKSAVLCRVMMAGGAEVYVCGSNPLSTQDDVVAALASSGAEVYATYGCTMEEYEHYIEMVLASRPNIIIDDGADLVSAIHARHPELISGIIGGCEETTTGIIRDKALEAAGLLGFPMICVNDAKCKHFFDNRYGTGQSVFDGVNRLTNLIVAGKEVVVAGYGWCGRGVAMRAKGLGARVSVTEIDPVKALEAMMDGFEVKTMDEAAPTGDLFITETGCCDVITERHFRKMKDGAILCNGGHFDVEIDVKWLEENAVSTCPGRSELTKGYTLEGGKTIFILSEGRLVNLASGDGHPVEIMDMSFAIQALGAQYVALNRGKLEIKCHDIPAEVDNDVAARKLASCGMKVDKLTEKQEEYLKSWEL